MQTLLDRLRSPRIRLDCEVEAILKLGASDRQRALVIQSLVNELPTAKPMSWVQAVKGLLLLASRGEQQGLVLQTLVERMPSADPSVWLQAVKAILKLGADDEQRALVLQMLVNELPTAGPDVSAGTVRALLLLGPNDDQRALILQHLLGRLATNDYDVPGILQLRPSEQERASALHTLLDRLRNRTDQVDYVEALADGIVLLKPRPADLIAHPGWWHRLPRTSIRSVLAAVRASCTSKEWLDSLCDWRDISAAMPDVVEAPGYCPTCHGGGIDEATYAWPVPCARCGGTGVMW
jgi:hypothetical protein